MGHAHLNTIETSIPCNYNTGQDQERADPVSTWILLHPYTKNFSESNKNYNFLPQPGLNNKQLLKHLPPIIANYLVNLDQERKNLQSENPVKSELEIEEDKDFYPDI